MRKGNVSHFRKWLWIYLLLVILGTTACYLLTYQQISSALHPPGGASASETHPSPNSRISALRYRIPIMLSAGAALIILSGVLWVRIAERRLTRPIRIIQQSIYKMSRGNLNTNVALGTADEFGQIGSHINELAANLQELLLYVWQQTGQCLDLLNEMHAPPNDQSEDQSEDRSEDQPVAPGDPNRSLMSIDDRRRLAELTSALKDLREMAKSYVFYEVHLDGDQAIAIRDSNSR